MDCISSGNFATLVPFHIFSVSLDPKDKIILSCRVANVKGIYLFRKFK